MDLNKVLVIGRLTRDPEMRSTPQGINVCSFSVATNYVYKTAGSSEKQGQVEYHNVVAWRKLAEIAHQYLKKGSKVYVEGRLQTKSWEGNDGVKKNRTEIILENMIMLDSKGTAGQSQSDNFAKSLEEEIPTINQETPVDEEISVEDIPF